MSNTTPEKSTVKSVMPNPKASMQPPPPRLPQPAVEDVWETIITGDLTQLKEYLAKHKSSVANMVRTGAHGTNFLNFYSAHTLFLLRR